MVCMWSSNIIYKVFSAGASLRGSVGLSCRVPGFFQDVDFLCKRRRYYAGRLSDNKPG